MATERTDGQDGYTAVVYDKTGGSDVLRLATLPLTEPEAGEVRVRVHISGVNPTDWNRGGATANASDETLKVPNQDGAGVIDAVGPGVDPARVGQRVWLWLSAYQRPGSGTAQQYTVVPEQHAVPLPDDASFDLGASLGVPALTAHRLLTLAADGPSRLEPGALSGRRVLVAGGAGAVGNAAIQLARWAGAEVAATVSSPAKGSLATAAGAHHVIDYKAHDAAKAIRAVFPDGANLIVEVAPSANAELDTAVIAPGGTVGFYANNGGDQLQLTVRPMMFANVSWTGMLLYTMTDEHKANAVADVSAAVAQGGLHVGEQHGLPLHRYRIDQTAQAHDAVEGGAIGKVLIDIP